MRMMTEDTQAEAIATAAELEAKTSRPHYVVKWFDGTFEITTEMPLMGRWFTSDGIRHG